MAGIIGVISGAAGLALWIEALLAHHNRAFIAVIGVALVANAAFFAWQVRLANARIAHGGSVGPFGQPPRDNFER